MTEMRILTVRQPWAWAIIHGGKDVENRVRNLAGAYRGPVAIHAGLAWDNAGGMRIWEINKIEIPPFETSGVWDTHGAILGVVDLVDVHVARAAASGTLVDWAEHTRPGELCSAWSEWDSYHLVLKDPRPLATPIPYKGALGLRRLPDDVVAQVLEGTR